MTPDQRGNEEIAENLFIEWWVIKRSDVLPKDADKFVDTIKEALDAKDAEHEKAMEEIKDKLWYYQSYLDGEHGTMPEIIGKLKAQSTLLSELAVALEEYGSHLIPCDSYPPSHRCQCTCGLDEALTKYQSWKDGEKK